MKCEHCGHDQRPSDGMRLTFRLTFTRPSFAGYACVTRGVDGGLRFPRSDDAPAEELTVYVEGV